MEISKTSGSVIYDSETAKNAKELIEEALKFGADLRDADLRHAYLRNANLIGADLRDVNLIGADLSGANLRDANLRGAYIRGADLRGANLRDADLRDADIGDADLRDANLIGAYLRDSDIRGANLSGANLRDADLRDANLRDANIGDANLIGANLSGANISGAINIPYAPLACPSDGEFTGWKKVNDCLIRLKIPEDAKRTSATTNKCRCDKALVLSITNIEETVTYSEVINKNCAETTYKAGVMVYPDSFDDDRWNECSHGIHFFINKQDAINY